jgi:hypothetical protein
MIRSSKRKIRTSISGKKYNVYGSYTGGVFYVFINKEHSGNIAIENSGETGGKKYLSTRREREGEKEPTG